MREGREIIFRMDWFQNFTVVNWLLKLTNTLFINKMLIYCNFLSNPELLKCCNLWNWITSSLKNASRNYHLIRINTRIVSPVYSGRIIKMKIIIIIIKTYQNIRSNNVVKKKHK